MSFDDSLNEHFPGAMPAWAFIASTQQALTTHGFDRSNTIACVGTCRDELCVPLRRAAQNAWGEAFNFSSLAGMLLLGKAGFSAAHNHAPIHEGRERYVYIAMPHIGFGDDGTVGISHRLGREGDSAMCGALSRILGELQEGSLDLVDDPDNPELSMLRRKISARLDAGEVPTLLELTRHAREIIESDLEHLIDLTVDRSCADYAVLTGTQIHGPHHANYVQPSLTYACVEGERRDLDPRCLYQGAVVGAGAGTR